MRLALEICLASTAILSLIGLGVVIYRYVLARLGKSDPFD